jgi:hypothetical protein
MTNTTAALTLGDTVLAPAGVIHADRSTTGTVMQLLFPREDVPLARVRIAEARNPVVVPAASLQVIAD